MSHKIPEELKALPRSFPLNWDIRHYDGVFRCEHCGKMLATVFRRSSQLMLLRPLSYQRYDSAWKRERHFITCGSCGDTIVRHDVDNRHQVIMAREDDTKTFIGYSFFEHDRFTVDSEGDTNPTTRRDRYPWSHLKDRMEAEK